MPPWAIPAAIVAVLAVVAVVVLTSGGDDDEAATDGTDRVTTTVLGGPGEIFAEPAASVGPDPFTPPVVTSEPPVINPTTTTAGTATSSSPPTSSTTSGGTSTTAPDSTTPSGATSTSVGDTGTSTTAGGGGGDRPQVIERVPGGTPGLYGGSMNDKICDVQQMIAFLEAEPDKAAAWAAAQGIPVEQIGDYLESLTPVLLMADTRVTNYGYDANTKQPKQRQAVLQAGTGVLVDQFGVPRARCKCGNPLGEPIAIAESPVYTGETWPGLGPDTTQVISPAPQPLDELVIVDPSTGTEIERPVGSDGSEDEPATDDSVPSTDETVPSSDDSTTSSSTTTSSTSTTTTTIVPDDSSSTSSSTTDTSTTTTDTSTTTTTIDPNDPTPGDVSATGGVNATSEFPTGEFPAALATDGDRSTSWFSSGADDVGCDRSLMSNPSLSCTTLEWFSPGGTDLNIRELWILNNSEHSVPEFRTGFGFDFVTVVVTNAAGVITARGTFDLAGEDPDVTVQINAVGNVVTLVFEGHENAECGGISELGVFTG